MKEKKKTHKLELTWPGKEDWEKPEPRLLLGKSTYGTKKGAEENLLIYDDNLLGLKALERDYTGKVKCVYIDPPYNTKSCFNHYDDSMEHSLWLNMMKERLMILHRLLREDGSIWISIDDSECHYLKVLCDEVFGRKNFVTTVIWQKRTSRENRKTFSINHDYILVYAKDYQKFCRTRNYLELNSDVLNRYKNPDNDPRGRWQSISMTVQGGHGTASQFYSLKAPNGKIHKLPKGLCWRYTQEKFLAEVRKNNIWFGETGGGVPRIKKFLREAKTGLTPDTLWFSAETGTNDKAKKDLIKLLPLADVFATPKPEELISKILVIATHPGDIVLDCFAGSGTTGAVAHKMKRRWIMIEMNGPCYTHILPRLQKVIKGKDFGGITKFANWKGGGGFRYCELAPSLLEKNKFNRWTISKKYNPVMLIEAMCLHAGYIFNPKREPWWMHGQSTENDFIFVTASSLTRTLLAQMSQELGENQSLLVYCGAFKADPKEFENLTIKKIPKSILNKCEWGRDDYSLKIALQEEAKQANKRKPKKQQPTSGNIIRMPMAAQRVRS